jgi:HEPN domain-containing protein
MELFKKWLLKAKRDIDSAEQLFSVQYHDTAIYHTQQCAEKALKGFLVFKNQPLQKTHNLVVLAKLCEKLDADFDDIMNSVYGLNGLDVEYRYGDDNGEDSDVEINEPEEIQVKGSIEYAREILNFVIGKCV